MKYIVLSDKLTDENYYYENKNFLEEKYLFMSITLANPRRLTIWTSPEVGCAKNMQEIQSVAELFGLISKSALEGVS